MPSLLLENDHHGYQEPLVKRIKPSTESNALKPRGGSTSRLFAPFRTIGLVSPTDVPFTSIPLGKTTFQINTSTGRSIQTYDLRKGLNLVFVSRPQTPEIITATVAWKDRVFAAWGSADSKNTGVWIFKRGRKVGELDVTDGGHGIIRQLLIFGSWIVGCSYNHLQIWKSTTYEHYATLSPAGTHRGKDGRILSGIVCSLPTFLNKVFVGRLDGSVEIWNISTAKLVYTVLPPSADVGAVSALQPTPALSIIAVAYEGGQLVIHNIKTDKRLLQLNTGTSNTGSVTSISFRTDGLGAGDEGRIPGVMACCSRGSGDVQFWDLNNGGRLMGILRGAHNPPSLELGAVNGGISKGEFLVGQAVLVTTGLDNSLKSWIFDETPFSPVPRILHSRSGHAAPVTRITFLPSNSDGADAEGKWLLSASRDRSFWGWSLRRDGQSTELSQGNVRKKAKKLGLFTSGGAANKSSITMEDLKAPEITCIATSLNRDGGMGAAPNAGSVWTNVRINTKRKGAPDPVINDLAGWESVVTGHRNSKTARTWFWGRKRAGRWAFETSDASNVTSVAMSACGTFAFVGSSSGGIDMFNLQSGLHRQSFPAKATPAQRASFKTSSRTDIAHASDFHVDRKVYGPGEGKHKGSVTGIMVDSVNRVVTSCGLDCKMKFWSFVTGTLMSELEFPTAITASKYHSANDLVAISCRDNVIQVVDIETRKVIRELRGSAATISDFCFSNDGRWIIAASAEGMIRVWDLPTSHLIDAARLESPCTALAFSNTGEYLTTAHTDSVGINIWSNRTLFTHVPTRPITENEVIDLQLPNASGEGGIGLIDTAFDESDFDGLLESMATGPDQLSEELMSLSLVPKARWQTLIQLDLIRQRNKPKEPPKAPEKVPFFLPSLEGSNRDATAPPPMKNDQQLVLAERSRIMKMDRNTTESQFTMLLRRAQEDQDYIPFITHLKTLSPAAADLEIRSLTGRDPDADLTSIDAHKEDELTLFVSALTGRLRQKLDYELVQAWMTVFLRVHGEAVQTDRDLAQALRQWRAEQEREGKRLGALTGYCAGVMAFLRSARA